MTTAGAQRRLRRQSAWQLVLGLLGLIGVAAGIDSGPLLLDGADALRFSPAALQPVDLHAGALSASVSAWLPWVFRRRSDLPGRRR